MGLNPVIGGGGFYDKSPVSSGGATNLSMTRDAITVNINSNTGTDATIPVATNLLAGVLISTDKVKLDGIEAAADVTDAVNIGSSINGASEKVTPINADKVPIIDTAAGNALKWASWTNIKAFLKTYFDSIYATVAQANANHSGDATGATVLTLANVNSNIGNFTNANITVNAKGLITAAANGTGGSSISTPKVAYVETNGSDGTGAIGNPALPFATATAAYNAGVTSSVEFVLHLGVGNHSLVLAADMNGLLKAIAGCGPVATVLNISGTPPTNTDAAQGYSTSCNYSNLSLDLNLPGGTATGSSGEGGGSAVLQTLTGTNCILSVSLPGGDADSSFGGAGGSGGVLRCSGDFTITAIDLEAGSGAGGFGTTGSLELDGCNLSACFYAQAPSAATFYRCTYQLSSITPGTALACAGF